MCAKPTGFLEFERRNAPKRPVEERLQDFGHIEQCLSTGQVCEQAARCMDCGIPFCHVYGCPLHNLVPDVNDMVYRGQWQRALELLHARNNFPEITGRICPAPCETACTLSLNQEAVTIRQLKQQNLCTKATAGNGAGRGLAATGKDVVIIGGGDTGADCLGTSLRQGARSVVQLEIMPEPPPERDESTPWPMWPYRLRTSSSHEEGGDRRWSVLTKEFFGTDGTVCGLRGVRVRWERRTAGGMMFAEVPDSDFERPAQLVLLAMGFTREGNAEVLAGFGVETDDRGNSVRDENMMSTIAGIFVAGDLSRGASLVVHAIADGRQAAEGVHQYLAGVPITDVCSEKHHAHLCDAKR